MRGLGRRKRPIRIVKKKNAYVAGRNSGPLINLIKFVAVVRRRPHGRPDYLATQTG